MKLAQFLSGLKTKELFRKATTFSDPIWRNVSRLVILRATTDLDVPSAVKTGVPVSTDLLHVYALLRGLGDDFQATASELTELMSKLSKGKWSVATPLVDVYLESLEALMLAASQKADPKQVDQDKRQFHVIGYSPSERPILSYSVRTQFEQNYTIEERAKDQIAPAGYAMATSMYEQFLKAQMGPTPEHDNMAA